MREIMLCLAGFCYLASQISSSTPAVLKTASIAQMHGPGFLARYSNTAMLGTTSITLMIRAPKSILSQALVSAGIFFCRWVLYRQSALRTFAAVYIGVNAFYLYPKYAREAFNPAWPWLLRHSNTWVLLMTAAGLMVSLCEALLTLHLTSNGCCCYCHSTVVLLSPMVVLLHVLYLPPTRNPQFCIDGLIGIGCSFCSHYFYFCNQPSSCSICKSIFLSNMACKCQNP